MGNIIKHENILSRIKMAKEVLTFGCIEIEKNNITPIFLKDVDIEKALVYNKISFGKKNL